MKEEIRGRREREKKKKERISFSFGIKYKLYTTITYLCRASILRLTDYITPRYLRYIGTRATTWTLYRSDHIRFPPIEISRLSRLPGTSLV